MPGLGHMSFSLKSLKGRYQGGYIMGTIMEVFKGDTYGGIVIIGINSHYSQKNISCNIPNSNHGDGNNSNHRNNCNNIDNLVPVLGPLGKFILSMQHA